MRQAHASMARPRHAGWREQLRHWWLNLPEALRSPWPLAFAWLAIAALLLGFHHVVSMSVRQGEILRQSAAGQPDATALCEALKDARMRTHCVRNLTTPPTRSARAGNPPNTAHLQIAQLGR